MTQGRRFLIWYWSGEGGGGRFALQLAKRMSIAFGTERVSLSLRENYPVHEAEAGLRVLRASIANDRRRPVHTFLGLNRGAAALNEHVKEVGADVVLVPMNFASALPLALGLQKPMVYFAHDPTPHPGDYAPRLQRILQKGMIARARAVAALSHYAADALRAQGVKKELHVVPLGAVTPPAALSRPAPGARPLHLLFMGRLLAYKGLELLAVALDMLASRTDWRLTIAGSGAEGGAMRARFETMSQLDCFDDRWFNEARMLELLASHDILVAPYTSATQSGVVADALARAVPVVATPVGALPEQLGDGRGGWISAAPTARAFAGKLAEALDARADYAAKSSAALALAKHTWARDEWSWLERL